MKIDLYDLVELTEDLNPAILKGMQGTVIAIYYNKIFEVEFVDPDMGHNWDQLLANVPNYTNIQPVIQVSEVVQ